MRKRGIIKSAQYLALAACTLTVGVLSGCSGNKEDSGLVAKALNESGAGSAVFKKGMEIDPGFIPEVIDVRGEEVLFFANDSSEGLVYEEKPIDENSQEVVLAGGEDEEESDKENPEGDGEEDANGGDCKFAIYDSDLKKKSEGTYHYDGQGFINSAFLLPDGNIGILFMTYNEKDDAMKAWIVKTDRNGKELAKAEVNEKTDYIRSVAVSDDWIALYDYQNVLLFDKDFNYKGKVQGDDFNGGFANEEGKIFAGYYGNNGFEIAEIDPDAKKLGTPVLKDNNHIYDPKSAPGYDCIGQSSEAIYGWDLASGKEEKIMDYTASGVIYDDVVTFAMLNAEQMLFIMREDNRQKAVAYRKVPEEELANKKTLTVGSLYGFPSSVRTAIIDFNEKNDEYQIRTVDYSELLTGEDNAEGFQEVEKQFKNDILTGNGPDLILTQGMTEFDSYVDKGVFEDLLPYFEKKGMKTEDYLENTIKAGSKNGKLYVAIPDFYVVGCYTPKENLNAQGGMRVSDLQALEKKYGCEGYGEMYATREEIIAQAVIGRAGSFVDVENRKCNLDSDEFRAFLEWLKTYPGQEDFEKFYDNHNLDYYTALSDHKSVVSLQSFYNFRDYHLTVYELFDGKNCAIVPYPSFAETPRGKIGSESGIALYSKSKEKDMAFDFIQTLYSDEVQEARIEKERYYYGFPSKKTAFERATEIAKEKPFYIDPQTGEKEYYDEYYYRGDKEGLLPVMTDEEIKILKEYIAICDDWDGNYYSSDLLNLIVEEAAPYFAGQKDLKEVSQIMQSRVSIYLKE